MQENELNISSFMQTHSPWKEKDGQTFLSKIIILQKKSHAIIIQEDASKAIRYLYLALLMSKKNAYNMNILISKIHQIKGDKGVMRFENMKTEWMKLIGRYIQNIHDMLVELHLKMQKLAYTPITILTLAHEYKVVDPLLILCIRAMADDYKMINALDCNIGLTLGQIQFLINKFFVDKGTLTNNRNKYVIYWYISEIQCQYFKSKEVLFENQNQNYEELSDEKTIMCQEYIMIQKAFSLL